MKTESLYFENPRKIKIREENLQEPGENQVQVRTLFSAISSGSEMLVYRGLMPDSMETDVGIKSLSGEMKYPMKYGYSAVGQVMSTGKKGDPSWVGKRVFVFHPHQRQFVSDLDQVFEIPDDLDDTDALFFPNMESAISFVMDGRPLPGEMVVIFGLGVVGLLTTAVLSKYPLLRLIAVDPIPLRREHALTMGAAKAISPQSPEFSLMGKYSENKHDYSGNPPAGADLIFELSGNPEALNIAVNSIGYNGRIVVGSWYGRKHASLELGGRFHRSQAGIISSQVSRISPKLSGRWSKKRRFDLVWDILKLIRPSKLITHSFDFYDAVQAYRMLDENPGETIQVILKY
ncbi:MAG: zinc-binding alcohol dehydrogenase [Calditrichaeota bacterium]|nr:MAG: zinc-binding alcohol dehydrogenase [Calditrichota bacterium]